LFLKVLLILLLVLGASRTTIVYEVNASNMDFVLAIDCSSSMLATDYKPSRLEAAKNAAKIFVDETKGKVNIAILSFAGISFIKEELTNDINKLKKSIDNISIELVGGTAIGNAIITAINLLTTSKNPRVVILLTDGQNTVGESIDQALEYAKMKGVVIHTVGIGSKEGGKLPGTNFITRLDEESLQRIAKETGGLYHKANTTKELEKIYKDIALKGTKKIELELTLPLLLLTIIILITNWLIMSIRYGIAF